MKLEQYAKEKGYQYHYTPHLFGGNIIEKRLKNFIIKINHIGKQKKSLELVAEEHCTLY